MLGEVCLMHSIVFPAYASLLLLFAYLCMHRFTCMYDESINRSCYKCKTAEFIFPVSVSLPVHCKSAG